MASGVAIPITIQVFKGSTLQKTETLNQETIKIGKLSSSHLQLEDESVSRMHAVIEVSPVKEVSVVDLGSTKGTFVNGTKITKQKLNAGDEVRIGEVRLVVTFEGAQPEEVEEAEELQPEPKMQADASEAPAFQLLKPILPPAPARPFVAPGVPAPFAAPPTSPAAPSVAAFQIPPAYGPKAYVPVVPVHIAEQVEVRDGTRAVEVSALFEEAVIEVRHFDDPAGGKVTSTTKALIGISALAIASFFLMFIFNFAQVAREKSAEEKQEKDNAALAAMNKKESHEKPAHERENPAKDALAFMLLGGGIAGMFYGLSRRSSEIKENAFTIGPNAGVTFKAPAEELPVGAFPLVSSTGAEYEVMFTSRMSGDMQHNGKSYSLSELASSGQAKPASAVAGAFVMPVPPDARINLRLGESVFNVNSVARPRAYPVPVTVDWGTQSYTGAVFAGIGLFMALMFSVPPDPKSLSLDAFMNDNRLAKFMVKPEEVKPEEMPAWLKQEKKVENSGGKKAKDAEGKMGKPDSASKSPKLFAIKGPATNTNPQVAKAVAREEAAKAGILGVLRSGQIGAMASILGQDSAIGRDATDAMGGLVGTEAGDAYGNSGFGMVGSGRGGGGTGEGTIGMGSLGTIGRGSGTPGGGRYGGRVGTLTSLKAGAPEVVPGTAEVRGSLDKELIRRIIRRHINEVKFCYERELTRNADLQGRVMVQFTIGGNGAVMASIVQSSTLGNPGVEQCIAGAVRRWDFPKPQGGIVVVTYPFVLKSAGD